MMGAGVEFGYARAKHLNEGRSAERGGGGGGVWEGGGGGYGRGGVPTPYVEENGK